MGLGGNPIGGYDELVVSLKLRYDAFRQQLASEMALAKKEIGGLKDSAQETENAFNSIGSRGAAAMGVMIGLVSTLTNLLLQASQQVASLVYNFVAGGIQINASMQQMTIAFSTILGSEEKAVAFMQELRKEAALIGANPQEFAQIGKSLLPYAKGDMELFQQILHVAEQLSVIDPAQGIKGAGFALRELLGGNPRSLAMRFELPVSELNKFKKEFEETGDLEKYMSNIADLGERFGAAKDAVAQMADTAIGKFRKMQFEISEIQRIMTAPLFAVMQDAIGQTGTAFESRADQIKAAALRVGATLAAFVKVSMEFAKVIIQTIAQASQIATGLGEQIGIILDGIQNVVTNRFADFVVWLNESVANAVNGVLKTLNSVIKATGGQEIELVKVDKEKIRKDAKDASDAVLNIRKDLGIKIPVIDDIGAQFDSVVDAYEAMFKDLLETQEFTLDSLEEAHQGFTEEDLAIWADALTQIGEEIDNHNAELEDALKEHEEKLSDISDDANKDRIKARRKANQDVEKENASAIEQAQEIEAKANEKALDIENDYQEKLKSIRDNADEELFDAINARDARRIYEIINGAKKESKQALIDRNNQLAQNAADRNRELAELKIHHENKIREIHANLDRELKEIEESEAEKRAEENESYRKRIEDLNRNFQARLTMLGKALANEGKLTAEGLSKVIDAVGLVYGPNGAYLSIMEGFNAQLALQAQQTAAILAAAGQLPTPGTPSTPTNPSPPPGGSGGGNLFLAEGFDGIVSSPTTFTAGESGPERLTVIPQGKPGFAENGGGDQGGISKVHVTVDARGVSESFEAQVADTVSKLVSRNVIASRRTRRR